MNAICLKDYPTTSDEQRIAQFCEKSDKLNLTFNVSVQFKIDGYVEPDIFKKALYAVVEQHDSMQLTFFKRGEKIYKSIERRPLEALPFSYHNFSAESDALQAINAIYTKSLNRPFDVYKEVPWRYHLCKIDATSYIGILTAHHLISDFNSALIIGKQLQYAYDNLASASALPYQQVDHGDLQAIEESLALEDQFFVRYKEDILQDIGGIQDLKFKDQEPLFQERTFELDSILFQIPDTTQKELSQLAQQQEISELSIYLTALQIAIHKQTKRNKFVIGLPVNVRPGRRFSGSVGYLSKPMPLRVDLEKAASYRELISNNGSSIKRTVRKRHFPLGRLYQQARAEKTALPKINVLFNYLDCSNISDSSSDIKISVIPQGFTHSTMDLWLTVQKDIEQTFVKLELSKDIFKPEQIRSFKTAYLNSLQELCTNYEDPIQRVVSDQKPIDLLITGSFTLDPIVKAITEIPGDSGAGCVPKLLPYQQVMQTLINTDSEVDGKVSCISILFRLEDFFKHGKSKGHSEKEIAEFCDSFFQAVSGSVSSKKINHQIIFCPDESNLALFDKYSNGLIRELGKIKGLLIEDLRNLSQKSIFHAGTNEAAHIPYTISFYKKLAFYISRHHYQSTRLAPKVIVLDCDHTLWRGVIGEDGMGGIEISEAYLDFQRKLIACYEQGVLLVLSSKNNEAEALEVFDKHPDMLLSREHIVAHRINWNPKAQSIQEMQAELNLGIDSFLFIDDNPVEVSQCRAQIPEMLSIQFPKEEAAIQTFVQYHWAINRPEKKSSFNRTQAYKQESERKEIKREIMSLEDYISALDVQVSYESVDENNIERASQLTLRTNQFNLTGERRSAAALQVEIENGYRCGGLISAVDKYGDYGIIGLILYRHENQKMYVENILLSCRVLGRGLEFHLCQWVLNSARQNQCNSIHIGFKDTGRNIPGFQFLKALAEYGDLDAKGLSIQIENLEKVTLGTFTNQAKGLPQKKKTSVGLLQNDRAAEADYLARALNVFEKETPAIREAIVDHSVLSGLWLNATHSAEVIPDLSFSDHGGSSLECVFLLTEINEIFKIELTIDELYANDTFQKLSGLIESKVKIEREGGSDKKRGVEVFLRDMELSYEDIPFQQALPDLPNSDGQVILLTGGTGFVGIHILRELLQEPINTEVICLVRSKDSIEAKNRLVQISEKYKAGIPVEEFTRVTCVSSDLGDSNLGLAPELWNQLSARVTKIIHCGAKVNFFDSYENLKKVNVESTRDLLKLATQGLPKQFLYISTIGVFHSEQNTGLKRFEENFATGSPETLPTGYQQSKWVSEKLVSRAMERGVNAQVVRLGVIAGNPDTQSMNLSDVFIHFLAAIYKMGAMPTMREMDFTPVNFAAKAVVKIMAGSDTSGGIYNLVSPKPISVDTLSDWAKLGGDKLDLVTYEAWKKRLDDHLERNPEDPLAKYIPLFRKRGAQSSFIEILLQAPVVSTSRTDALLGKNGLAFPDISQEMLMQYQSAYVNHGLIAPDSSLEIKSPNNLFWIVEEMDGFVQQQPISKLKDEDYFNAFAKGKEAGHTFRIDFKAHVKSLTELMNSGKVFLNGKVYCPAIDPDPLEVQEGLMTMTPFGGYSPGRKDSLIFLTYQVHCISRKGKAYIMNGFKVSSKVPNMFYELTQVLFTIKEKENPQNQWVGMIEIPFQQLFRDQINKMTFREGLSDKEKLKCQSAWMGMLTMHSMKNYMNLILRDNPIDWEDLYAFAKGVPPLEAMVNRYLKQLSGMKKFGLLSKLSAFQMTNWFKKKTI